MGERAGRMFTLHKLKTASFYVTTAISQSNKINPSWLYVVAEIIKFFVVALEHKIDSP